MSPVQDPSLKDGGTGGGSLRLGRGLAEGKRTEELGLSSDRGGGGCRRHRFRTDTVSGLLFDVMSLAAAEQVPLRGSLLCQTDVLTATLRGGPAQRGSSSRPTSCPATPVALLLLQRRSGEEQDPGRGSGIALLTAQLCRQPDVPSLGRQLWSCSRGTPGPQGASPACGWLPWHLGRSGQVCAWRRAVSPAEARCGGDATARDRSTWRSCLLLPSRLIGQPPPIGLGTGGGGRHLHLVLACPR